MKLTCCTHLCNFRINNIAMKLRVGQKRFFLCKKCRIFSIVALNTPDKWSIILENVSKMFCCQNRHLGLAIWQITSFSDEQNCHNKVYIILILERFFHDMPPLWWDWSRPVIHLFFFSCDLAGQGFLRNTP